MNHPVDGAVSLIGNHLRHQVLNADQFSENTFVAVIADAIAGNAITQQIEIALGIAPVIQVPGRRFKVTG